MRNISALKKRFTVISVVTDSESHYSKVILTLDGLTDTLIVVKWTTYINSYHISFWKGSMRVMFDRVIESMSEVKDVKVAKSYSDIAIELAIIHLLNVFGTLSNLAIKLEDN